MKAYINACLLLVGLLILPAKAAEHSFENKANSACTDSDCSKALRRLLRLDRSNNAPAFIAMAYATGDGLEQNTEQAIHYLKMGVRQRNPVAVNLMSDWLRNGFLVEQNLTEAANLLEQAVKLNYAPAQYRKALQLLQTEEPNALSEAIHLLEQASAQHLLRAMLLLAQLKQYGVGTEHLKASNEYSALLTELREVEMIVSMGLFAPK